MTRTARRAILAVLLALGLPAALRAQDPLGSRLKLEGRWDGERLVVERVKARDPRRDPAAGSVEGTIASRASGAPRVRVGPIEIEWNRATRFLGLGPDDLEPGRAIEVSGTLVAPGRLLAATVEPAAPDGDRLAILGHVTRAVPRADGTMLVDVLGVEALAPPDVTLRTASLIRDPDDRRPAEQLTLSLFGRPLVIGGEFGSRLKIQEDFAFDAKGDDRVRLEEELQLEFFYAASPDLAVFLEAKVPHERDLAAAGGREQETRLERGETWVHWTLPDRRFALQVGRQAFREPREWWWDADLDAARLWVDRFPFALEVGAGMEHLPVSTMGAGLEPEDQDVARVLGHASWRALPDFGLELFALRHEDRSDRPRVGARRPVTEDDPSDGRFTWVGVRAAGDVATAAGDVDYGLDVAWVGGRETRFDFDDRPRGLRVTARRSRRVRGWAVDGRATWRPRLPLRPALTLGYAAGSGDDDERGSTHAFRQTGLQDNNGRFRGVDRFRFYGELLDPELTNLHVATVALGFPLFDSSSVEFLYHVYRQDVAAPFLDGTKLKADPLGRDDRLGQEWDIVLGLEEWEHVEIEIVGMVFRAGPAFGPAAGEFATGAVLKLDYNF